MRVCDANMSFALCRLLGCLEADPAVDRMIRDAQAVTCERNLDSLTSFFRSFDDSFSEFVHPFDAMQDHVTDPHEKRELRIQAYEEMQLDGKFEDHNGTQSRSTVKAKMKGAEKAKAKPTNPVNEKWPRMVFDLGVDASLLGTVLLGCVKEGMSSADFIYRNARICFCKSPSPWQLAILFRRLIEPEYDLEFVCFSDDATLAIRIDGRVVWVNTDISQADASYTPALFEQACRVLPTHCQPTFRRLIKQCKLPFKIRSCFDPKIYAVFAPLLPVLYSGSTLTTFINTLANFNIAMAFADAYLTIRRPEDLVGIARRAGFIITVDTCEFPEDIQFLKHSPVLDTDGEWQPLLNLGVLLRASGMCMGDLPGRGDLVDRAIKFQRGLLRGAYPYATFPLLDRFWSAVGHGEYYGVAEREFYRKVTHDAYPTYRVDVTSFCRRYRSTYLEHDYLCELVSNCCNGYAIRTSMAESVLLKDYGLQSESYNEPSFFYGPIKD